LAKSKKTQNSNFPTRKGFPIDNAPLPKSLGQVNLNAAGIDIGSTQHYVAVPIDRDESHVRCFGTFTSDLVDSAIGTVPLVPLVPAIFYYLLLVILCWRKIDGGHGFVAV
jgi:hypothetical protein